VNDASMTFMQGTQPVEKTIRILLALKNHLPGIA
jgi:hypothetical protein